MRADGATPISAGRFFSSHGIVAFCGTGAGPVGELVLSILASEILSGRHASEYPPDSSISLLHDSRWHRRC